MIDIRDLAVEVAIRYNRENDIPFISYIQSLIMQSRGTLMQQYLDKVGDLPYHYYTTIDSISVSSQYNTKNAISSGTMKKYPIMKDALPKIYTIKNNQRNRLAIKYLGNIGITEAYTYIIPARIEAITKGDRFTDITNYYSIINNKVVLYNMSRKFFTIEAAFVNPIEALQFANNNNLSCTSGFELTFDEANKIKSFVYNELDSNRSQDKEIELNEQ